MRQDAIPCLLSVFSTNTSDMYAELNEKALDIERQQALTELENEILNNTCINGTCED